MKKFSFLLWMLMMALSINAAPRSFSQARAIALNKATVLGVDITSSSKSIKRSMIKTSELSNTTDESFYVFPGTQGKGYIIVAGDDRMPDIVGYSTDGTFDAENLPEAFKSFLQLYDKTLEAAKSNDAQVLADIRNAKANRNAQKHVIVEPLLGDINWAQSMPFNAMCPNYYDTSEENTLTGCVATAMSQIMRYYKYPETIQADIRVYNTTFGDDNLDKIPAGTRLDWDNMLPQYVKGEYNEQQQNAVATLMLAAGMSVEAAYSYTNTGAYLRTKSLVKYFGYDPDIISMLYRDGYNVSEWTAIIDNELANKRPILYAASDAQNAGHAFVCDGCDENGLYHINWGWASTNGYYDISILNPIATGEPKYEYTNKVQMIVGIAPDNKIDDKPIVADYGLTFTNAKFEKGTNPDTGAASMGITLYKPGNRSLEEFKGYLGIAYWDANGDRHLISNGKDSYFKMDAAPNENQYYYSQQYYIRITKNLQPGTYTLIPVAKKDGNDWQIIRGQGNRIKLKVTDTDASRIDQDIDIRFNVPDKVYAKTDNVFSITFTNNDNEDIDHYLKVNLGPDPIYAYENISSFRISLRPGESVTKTMTCSPYEKDRKYITVRDEMDKTIASKEMNVVDYIEPRITIISAQFNNIDKTMKHEVAFNVRNDIEWDIFAFNCINDVKTNYSCEIQNQGGPCTTRLYLMKGGVSYFMGTLGMQHECIRILTDVHFDAGETKKLDFDIDISEHHGRLFGVGISTNAPGYAKSPILTYSNLEPAVYTSIDGNATMTLNRDAGECIAYCVDNADGIESTTTNAGVEVAKANGGITLKSCKARHLCIYHISGSKICDVNLQANTPTTIMLPAGMYIVNGRKVVVNGK